MAQAEKTKKKQGYTPLMEQYLQVKKETPGCLLLFRLGDFYECFFEDAKTVSRELELTLTGRDCGMEERAPMCGVPYHAVEGYLQRLVEKGYKVAICEQMEDPKQAVGLVRREITRIVTPGTNINSDHMEEKSNHYLVSLTRTCDRMAMALCDITTGEFAVTEFAEEEKFWDEIAKIRPSELILNEEAESGIDMERLRKGLDIFANTYEGYHFHYDRCADILKKHFHVMSLEGLGVAELPLSVCAAGALLDYLLETQKRDLNHISHLAIYSLNQYMMLDNSTRRNLELTETMRDKTRQGSLLWVLDDTKTAMGGRMLKKWIERPLIEQSEIQLRLDGVEELTQDLMVMEELKEYLNQIYDMERLMGRLSYGSGGARDLLALKTSLTVLPAIGQVLGLLKSPVFEKMSEEFDDLADIHALLEKAVNEDPPITVREGRLIKNGYNEQVDHLRHADADGKKWLMDLEAREKEKTGIRTLKVGYNRVFGYFIEVSKSFMSQVPETYIRKQTLAGGERYITEELKKMEDEILGAKERLVSLEYDLFIEIRSFVASQMERVQKTADLLATLDALRSLASVASRSRYVKPVFHNQKDGHLKISGGRHPVVEKMLKGDSFIPNDTYLDQNGDRVSIITGPNMAGKSTYMRQVAVICLMAQIGSFVPADLAELSVVDRIFTRVGASDDLGSGQSTFMVEMAEVSNILMHATKKSLLILDEIGRGTSTYDGLSIAWAVVEYIADPKKIGAKSLFATHYHELTELEGTLDGVRNYCVAIKENDDGIVFLRKIQKGATDRSYGIEVAKLAGLPDLVVNRASNLLAELLEKHADKDAQTLQRVKNTASSGTAAETALKEQPRSYEEENEKSEEPVRSSRKKNKSFENQMSLFGFGAADPAQEELMQELKAININEMTPMAAMQKLYELIEKAKTV